MSYDLTKWITHQRGLLNLELEEENQQLASKILQLSASECQAAGLSLLGLDIDSTKTTLFGRCTVCVRSAGENSKALNRNSFKVGDEVKLYNPKYAHTKDVEDAQIIGVISKVSNYFLEVVTDDSPSEEYFLLSYNKHLHLLSYLRK